MKTLFSAFMIKARFFLLGILTIGFAFEAFGQGPEWTSGRPDGHAPIGVMADHVHEKGEVMISYRVMRMEMDGNRDGSERVPTTRIVSPVGLNFRVTPTRMPMTMHMLGVMYAPADRLTLMFMVPVLDTRMDHLMRPGSVFTTEFGGVGDISVTALVGLGKFGRQTAHLNFGIRLPSGSIEQQDVTPMSAPNQTRLPYPMQLGSGTVDLSPGFTYLAQSDDWSGGGQVLSTIRTGENDAGYRLGHRFLATGWVARRLGNRWSLSLRLASEKWGAIEGPDSTFDMAVAMRMVPTVFPDLRGGDRLDVGAGFNVVLRRDRPAQTRVGVEVLTPVYQNLHGPQLETDVQIIGGLQVLF